jgi:hypothetical protein
VHQGEELRIIDGSTGRGEGFSEGVGEREVHVVAAEEQVFPDCDAFQGEVALMLGHRDQAEVRRATADVADQQKVSGLHLRAPGRALTLQPSVECRLRLFEQCDLSEPGLGRGFQGERARGFVEGGGHRDHRGGGGEDLVRATLPLTRQQVGQQLAGDFERGPFLRHHRAAPGQQRTAPVHMRVTQPALGRKDQTVRLQSAPFAGVPPEQACGRSRCPRQHGGGFARLAFSRQVDGGRQKIQFSDTVRRHNLGDRFQGRRALGAGGGQRAVARAQINSEKGGHAAKGEERSSKRERVKCEKWRGGGSKGRERRFGISNLRLKFEIRGLNDTTSAGGGTGRGARRSCR